MAARESDPSELSPPVQALTLNGGPVTLPLPWPPGSEVVRMTGVVALKRRIAKRLLFANIVPEPLPEPLPDKAQASLLRRVWRSPLDLTGPPVQVQLILGKTIENNLVSEGHSLRPG